MSEKWDYDATAALLRFGRKNSGPWEDGIVPDDGDTDMIISAPQVAADYAALLAQYEDLMRVMRNIEVHFEQLCDHEMRLHGFISHDHDIDFQVFRALCGYKECLEEKYALREAVAWERECIDTWEYGTALKMQALDEQVASMLAARAEVDRLMEEGK